MACNSLVISSPVAVTTTKDIFREPTYLRRSLSSKDLCEGRKIRRSHSDSHLCYSVSRFRASSTQSKLKSSRSFGIFNFHLPGSIFPNSLRSFLFDLETSKDMKILDNSVQGVSTVESDIPVVEEKRSNWVERLMEIRSHWIDRQQKDSLDGDTETDQDGEDGTCEVDYGNEEEKEEMSIDSDSFSAMLARISTSHIKILAQLAFLCNMAYVIPEIKEKDLRRYYGLDFVTSSLEKKAEAAALKAKPDEDSSRLPVVASGTTSNPDNGANSKLKHVRPYIAYDIAASAASYVQSRAKDLLSLGSEPQEEGRNMVSQGSPEHLQGVEESDEDGTSPSRVYKSEVAAIVAASTMTAVVAADEKEKQKAATDLQSLHSSPCEWFVCDDSNTYTRSFIIQGSDSLASWQANLFFEPTKFEGTDVLVHRGIYEAAKGIFEQFMPEIIEHLNRYEDRAKLQFTGHSLGGSLSLLVNLMLLSRKVVKPSALLPVVTFGSPFVFCGGQKILDELALDDNHVHCVMMHRDIVPRAFSCNYPNHVAQLLKRLNGSFRTHPCLNKNKLLYSPIGKIFIIQPDEKFSPPHPLLPPGSAIYALGKTQFGSSQTAVKAFLNSPHPLDTLSDPTAYGSEGTILRDHDSSNYLKALNGVVRQHRKTVDQKVRKHRSHLWPLLNSQSPHAWSHDRTLEKNHVVHGEVMTRV